jgi:ABC-2 type transport system ATP-binding protein
MNVIESAGLGKRYGRTWALRDCTLAIPGGHVVALVGPNGAGKTTLLSMAVGLTTPTAGVVTVLGGDPAGSPDALDRIAFVAQDAPLYKNLPAADMLHLARNLNRRWDQQYAQSRLADLGIPLGRKVGKLSGGQQAQLALTIALARRPDLLVLDEPLAMLDPVARDDFMASVLSAVAADGVSVVLSSHVLAELERMADYLIVLSHGQVQVAGEVEDLLARHRMLTAPAAEVGDPAGRMHVVQRRLAGQQSQLLIRTATPAEPAPAGWQSRGVALEELVLAYLRESGAAAMPGVAEVQTGTRTEVQA